eukprot:829023-Rhodomonas_salina.4
MAGTELAYDLPGHVVAGLSVDAHRCGAGEFRPKNGAVVVGPTTSAVPCSAPTRRRLLCARHGMSGTDVAQHWPLCTRARSAKSNPRDRYSGSNCAAKMCAGGSDVRGPCHRRRVDRRRSASASIYARTASIYGSSAPINGSTASIYAHKASIYARTTSVYGSTASGSAALASIHARAAPTKGVSGQIQIRRESNRCPFKSDFFQTRGSVHSCGRGGGHAGG